MKKRKLIIYPFLLLILFFGLFCISYIVDTNLFYSKHSKYSDKYVLKVTYLLINKKNVHEGLTFDNIYKEGHNDVTMASTNTDIPLEKKGNYLYADLNKYANEIVFRKQVDYGFAEYNFNGIRLNDCEYDKKTKMIKIPYSYYKNKKQNIPVQFELVSAVDKKELKNIDVNVKTKNIYTKKTIEKVNSDENRLLFKVNTKFKVKTANDIEIYVNNNKNPLPEELFAYNTNSNMIGILISPLIVNNVDIRIKNDKLSLLADITPENRISITRNGRTMSNIGVGGSVDPASSGMNAVDLGNNVPSFTSSTPLNSVLYSVTFTVGSGNYKYCNTNQANNISCGGAITVTDAHGHTETLHRSSGIYNEDVPNSGNNYQLVYVGSGGTYYSPFYKDGYMYSDFLYPYTLHLGSFSNSSYKLTLPNIWLAMPCVHNSSASSTNANLIMDVELSKLGKNYAVLHLHSSDSRTAPYNQAIDSYLKIKWTPPGKIIVNKRIHGDEYNNLSGFTVNLYSNNTCTNLLDSKASNNYGIVEFTGLTAGTTYYVKESGHDTTKWQNDGCVSVTIPNTPNGTGEYISNKTYYNTRKNPKGMIEVYKHKANSNKDPIEGVTIRLYNSSGQMIADKTTSRLGLAVFTGLPAGTYKLQEISAPSGYTLNTTVYEATISLSTDDAFFYKGLYAGYGYNDKFYNDTYSDIKKLYNSQGKYFSYKHYIDSGLSENRIGARNFRVAEYMGNKGGLEAHWEANKTTLEPTYGNIYNWAFWHYLMHIDSEQIPGRDLSYYKGLSEGATGNNTPVVTVTMTNQNPYGMIEVYKYDDSTSAHMKIPNVKIKVTGPNGLERTLTTNSNGYAKTNGLPAGTYKVKEISTIAGYELNPTEYTVNIVTNGDRTFSRNGVYWGYSFDAVEYKNQADPGVQSMTNLQAFNHYINSGLNDCEQSNPKCATAGACTCSGYNETNYQVRRGAKNFSAHEYLKNYPDLVNYWNNNTGIHSKYNNNMYVWAAEHYSSNGIIGSESRIGRSMSYYQSLPEYDSSSEDNNSVTVMVPIPNTKIADVEKGAIKVKKILKNPSSGINVTREYSRFKFDIYDSSNELVDTLTLNSDGEACFGFENDSTCSGEMLLNEGDSYTIKERIDNSASISPYRWTNLSGDVSVVITSNDVVDANFTNVENYYWCSIQKKDTETSEFVGGATFDLYDTSVSPNEKIGVGSVGNVSIVNGVSSDLLDSSTCLDSDSNVRRGTLSFVMLSDIGHTFKVKETNSNGFEGTTNSGVSNKYWNNLSDNYSSALNCTQMAYNKTTNKYSCTGTSENEIDDTKQHFCIKVRKVDGATNQPLGGVRLVATNANDPSKVFNATTDTQGYAVFDLGDSSSAGAGDYNVTEAVGGEIEGYEHWNGSVSVTPTIISMNETTANKTTCVTLSDVIENYQYVLNWYKVDESNTGEAKAKFSLKNSDNTVMRHSTNKKTYTDSNGKRKSCYVFDRGETTNPTNASTSHLYESDTNGEICVIGVPSSGSEFTITEETPLNGHTNGSSTTKQISESLNFAAKSNDNTFINYPTEFEFTKEITGNYGINPNRTIMINQLRKLRFNIKNSSGTVMKFILNEGVYEYSDNDVDPITGTIVTNLQLQNEVDNQFKMKLTVKHLPVGSYTIEEIDEGCRTSLGNTCNGSGSYLPSPVSFEITKNYNTKATASMTNVMTELTFTKKDLYSYEDPSDVVKFENNEEIKAFDDISFKLKDENGKYLNVTSLGNVGNCNTTNGYSEYLYNPDAEGDGVTGTVLHTCGGNLKIENLCRERTYTIEEVEVPVGTVFIKPSTNPTVSKTISKTGTITTNPNNKVEISDTPTRVVFEKKDSRNNTNVVNDQNAEFEVYRCKKGETTCTTSSSAEKMHFIDKTTINDEMAYKAISSSDITAGTTGVTTLKLNNDGKIILRYLPANYSYILYEKKAPKGFYQMTESVGNINFTVLNNNITGTVNSVTNYPTSIKLTKEDIYRYYSKTDVNQSDTSTKEFDKIKFRLYDNTGTLVKLKKVQNGEYKYYNNDGTHNGTVEDLYTLNGEFTITHLDRNTKYYIEEYNADNAKEFILPNNINNSSLPGSLKTNKHPIVSYTIGNDTSTANPAAISNMIENKPTRVAFKKVDLNTNEIVNDSNKVATFRVYQCALGTTCKETNGTLIYFENSSVITGDSEDIIDGTARKAYKYSKLNASSGMISDLKLDNGYLVLRYLPTDYNYVLVETSAPDGYYNPPTTEKYTQFSVLSTTLDSGETYALPGNVKNTPIEITFTKEDFYKYMDSSDKVKFESEEEVKAFDDITFNLKDRQGNVISLCKKADVTEGGKTINVYQYLNGTCSTKVTNLHTQNGKLRITHLFRATSYKIEEVAVPSHSVFMLPTTHPEVTYTISTEGTVTTNASNKKTMSNVPTKVLIYKKDDRTNTNIHEGSTKKQTASFELYRCSNTTVACKKSATSEKVVFMKKASLTNQDIINDNSITDGDIGKEAYKFVSTSDYNAMSVSDRNTKTTTTLELDSNGQILLRYLPSNYKYVLIEKNAPDGYYNYVADSNNDEVSIDVSNTGTNGTVYNFVDAHTEIRFNKDDIYKYYKKTDRDKLNSDNKIFDSMTFVLRDQSGNIVKLTKVQDGEYRFIQTDGTYASNTVTNLHTKDGTFVITHLYRNETYYIEEIKSDTDGNFILPNNINNSSLVENQAGSLKNNKHPIVKYNIPNIIPTGEETKSLTQLIENKPSRVVFEKRDSKTGELINDLANEDNSYENIRTTFNVYQCAKTVEHCTVDNGVIVNFEERQYNQDLTNDITVVNQPIYTYYFSKLNGNGIKDLHTDRGVLVLSYLPTDYKYVLYETVAPNGYYNPKKVEAQTEFEVKSTTLDSGETYEVLTSRISNDPTEIYFKKTDLYDYYESSDVYKLNKEEKIFDNMRFVLRNKRGEILRLKKTSNGVYRYLPYNNQNNNIELRTYNGNMTITHLYKGETYYIEEVKSDDEGIFILPNYLTYDYELPFNHNGHPVVKYELPNNIPQTSTSVTQEINNTPSRVVFEKRDSKYGFLITDETTTFNVYQCSKTVEHCTTENGTIVNFENRSVINNDDEDYGKEVYKFKKLNANGVKDLHPYKGQLIMRYLPSGYKYVLVETVSPLNYILPEGENARIEFTISEKVVQIEEVDVANKPTSLLIRKYSDDGKLMPDTEFRLYEVKNYDSTKPISELEKVPLKLKTVRDGIYESRETRDTDTIKTCKDNEYEKCSDINTTLTYDEYLDTWTNFEENSVNQNKEKVEIQEGEALIEYLEYGKYYIVEETKAPKGYSLPEGEARFHLVYIDKLVDVLDTEKAFVNKPVPFTFYKYDEYNELIDGAKFKLQKLNSNKKYVDVPITKEEIDDKLFYKVDYNSSDTLIETLNGSATVYYLEEGQYRIVEVKAPEGKELPKKSINVVTFFVDKSGNVYGNNIIVNKSKTETTTYNPSASAELIVNISTGQTVVKYGLIIASMLGIISGLIYIQRRKRK